VVDRAQGSTSSNGGGTLTPSGSSSYGLTLSGGSAALTTGHFFFISVNGTFHLPNQADEKYISFVGADGIYVFFVE
jgi:hypothetical protein